MEPIGLSITDTGIALGGKVKPLSRATIYREISKGTLEAIKLGQRTLVTVDSIKARVASADRVGA